MADLKISALPPASTPLAGTEVLPIVQSGTTRKVSVSDLTAGRAVSAGDLSYTGTLTGSTGVLNIGSGQLYKDAGGRVGIATASPSTNLSVGDDSTSVSRQISLHGPASGTNNGASINVRNGTDTVFAVGNASNIIGGAYSSDAMLFWGNAALRFYGNGAERARIDSSGNITASTGNLVVGTAGKGIDFSANTHAPGMTSELLNRYEEGTFTPTWTTASGSGAIISLALGWYQRIGNRVNFDIAIATNGHGTASGAITLGGLPFASTANSNQFGGGYCVLAANAAYPTGSTPALRVNYNATTITPIIFTGTSGDVTMTAADWGVSGSYRFSGSYQAA